MTSNCYIISQENYNGCIVIDPGTEDCKEIIEYFETRNLEPEYIFLTHEHSDHTWGCNTLIDKYNAKVVTSNECKKALPKESNAYFQFYFDDPNYTYNVKQVD